MDKIENLKKLKLLFDDGILTEKEFSEMKYEILTKIDNEIIPSGNVYKNHYKESPKIKSGVLTISFAGQWFLFDAKTKLFINDELHSTHSIKNGFSVDIPILSDKLTIKVVLMSIKTTVYELEELDKTKDYSFGLIYDMAWGKYSNKFNLYENG